MNNPEDRITELTQKIANPQTADINKKFVFLLDQYKMDFNNQLIKLEGVPDLSLNCRRKVAFEIAEHNYRQNSALLNMTS